MVLSRLGPQPACRRNGVVRDRTTAADRGAGTPALALTQGILAAGACNSTSRPESVLKEAASCRPKKGGCDGS
jgi:hypothetical protein